MPTHPNPEPTAKPAQLRGILENNLTFTLGSEEFGIQILHIKPAAPRQPAPPPASEGLVAIDGDPCGPLIPVADLSLAFDFRPRAYTDRTCIVVVRAQPPGPKESKERLLNALSTKHAQILNIASEDIELAPDFGDGAPMPSLLGMARVHGKVKLLKHPIHALLKIAGDA